MLIEDWARLFPPPSSYHHPPALHLPPFMGLGKFTAGRIHKMRAGKSDQAKDPFWRGPETDTLCRRCSLEPETFAQVSSPAPHDKAPAHVSSMASSVSVRRPPSGPLSLF